jgi:2',3'-cyclic-nucleotide 2'-phosphodiesterase (5'-nucleotidase family)
MRSKWVVLLIPFVALAALGFYRPAAPEPRALSLSIVFGSEINGYITPCGCSKPMVGGIPRRATLLKQLAEKHTLLALENGDLTKATGRQDELKAEALIEMLNAMGYDALNLGRYDFQLGMDYLRALQAQFKGAMLCGNVQEGGNPAFDAYTLVEKSHLNRPVRVLIAGLISEKYADAIRKRNPHLSIIPAAQKLDALRSQIESMGDLRVLLFYGAAQEATQLAQAHPYFHLIVYAGGGDGPLPTKQVGQTRLGLRGQRRQVRRDCAPERERALRNRPRGAYALD